MIDIMDGTASPSAKMPYTTYFENYTAGRDMREGDLQAGSGTTCARLKRRSSSRMRSRISRRFDSAAGWLWDVRGTDRSRRERSRSRSKEEEEQDQ